MKKYNFIKYVILFLVFLILLHHKETFSQETQNSLPDFVNFDYDITDPSNNLSKAIDYYKKNGKLRILLIGDSHSSSEDFIKGFYENLQDEMKISSVTLLSEKVVKTYLKKKRKFQQRVSNSQKILFKSDKKGVTYFNYSSNGKMFEYFVKNQTLTKLLKNHQPNLVIIFLGTNDAVSDYDYYQIYNSIENLYTKVYQKDRSVILVTSPEVIRRGTILKKIEVVNQAIKDVCTKYGIAYYDLYEASGGYNSRIKWAENNLSHPDMIHFNGRGYYLIGHMIANSISRYINNQYNKS